MVKILVFLLITINSQANPLIYRNLDKAIQVANEGLGIEATHIKSGEYFGHEYHFSREGGNLVIQKVETSIAPDGSIVREDYETITTIDINDLEKKISTYIHYTPFLSEKGEELRCGPFILTTRNKRDIHILHPDSRIEKVGQFFLFTCNDEARIKFIELMNRALRLRLFQ